MLILKRREWEIQMEKESANECNLINEIHFSLTKKKEDYNQLLSSIVLYEKGSKKGTASLVFYFQSFHISMHVMLKIQKKTIFYFTVH